MMRVDPALESVSGGRGACRRLRCGRTARTLLLSAPLWLLVLPGCGPTFGAWMYTLGMVPKQESKADFKLPAGPVMVLVDDDQDLIQPPIARQALVDALAKQLKEHKIAERVTTNEEIARLRQTEANFDQRGAREVGKMGGAKTVVWIVVKQFNVESDLDMTVTPATFVATLKVVNAEAKKREEVRLWPPDREGRLMSVTVAPQDVRACKSRAEVHEKMGAEMADKIAKLFYDYEMSEEEQREQQ
jgi:hypothetical protein